MPRGAQLLLLSSLASVALGCSRAEQSPIRREEVAPDTARKRPIPQEEVAPEPARSLTRLRPDEALHREFTLIRSLRELAPSVTAELGRRIDEPMADQGEPFESTDVVLDDSPSRRFVVAGVSKVSPRFWVLGYEHGGIGYHFHIALFEIVGRSAVVRKAGQWLPRATERRQPLDLARVVDALREDEQARYAELDDHW